MSILNLKADENVEIVNNRVTRKNIGFELKVFSGKYGLDVTVVLQEEKDPFIFDSDSTSMFVVLNKDRSKGVDKASGSIIANRYLIWIRNYQPL